MRSILFLDMDSTMCLNDPYGGFEARESIERQPADLYEKLFSAEAVKTLNIILEEFNPLVVISSEWKRFFKPKEFLEIFTRTGLGGIELHQEWCATAYSTRLDAMKYASRLDAIESWLFENHRGEPFVVLDDLGSGISLAYSWIRDHGNAVLCQRNIGLNTDHLDQVRAALSRPPKTFNVKQVDLTGENSPTERANVKRLVEKHQSLFHGFEPRLSSKFPSGWFALIDKLCTDIEGALTAEELKCIEVLQIAEDFETLTFRWYPVLREGVFIDPFGEQATLFRQGKGSVAEAKMNALVIAAQRLAEGTPIY